MDKFLSLNKKLKFHFTGIGGVSMSALAEHLHFCGHLISGSDIKDSDAINRLKNLGIGVHLKHSSAIVKGADYLVYTSAIDEFNPEIKYAKRKKIPLIKRSELLGEIISNYKRSVAVSGSHGKTTTTAMLAETFISAGVNPTVFLGGESKSFSSYRQGGDDLVIAEACEYKQNFLDIKPNVAVVLNVDKDHTDCYKDEKEIVNAFREFTKNSILVINADDKHFDELFNSTTVTFGIENKANFTAKNIKYNKSGYSFTLCAYDRPVGRINLKTIGRHNVYNALATFAVAEIFNVPFVYVKKALESFSGVKRRSEFLGVFNDKTVYADYAHHPNEIKATISAFNDSGKDFAVVFQPHTYSRTKSLLSEFTSSLKDENVIIYKTFPAREKFDACGSERALYDNIYKFNPKAEIAINEDELIEKLYKLNKDIKRLIFLGAGDIYDIAKNLVKT